ncbi:hypothetical protein ACJMK2_041871 [Sinanodonta woodiana]|uniref:Pikachurin n=1 Tax=Sinanodonta woodiana TaxID=1069815 RepID=A0ABD3W8U3_SINWO
MCTLRKMASVHCFESCRGQMQLIALLTFTCLFTQTLSRPNEHVVAFFQGHCIPNSCQHLCKNIDNGGYICTCREGYRLNKDGFTCSALPPQTAVIHSALLNHQTFYQTLSEPGVIKPVENSPDSNHLIHSDGTLKAADGDHIFLDNQNVDSKETLLKKSKQKTLDKDGTLLKSGHQKTDVLLSENDSEQDVKIKSFDYKQGPSLEYMDLKKDSTDLKKLVPDYWTEQIYKEKTDNVNRKKLKDLDGCRSYTCEHNGTCLMDGGHARCDCPFGTSGEKCEKVTEVRYPKFYGNSYLALPVLKNAYKDLEIFMEFKPTANFGLLLFSSEFENAKADFFSLALIDGFAEFRFDCGTGTGVIRSEQQVLVGNWNTIRITRSENKASLWLNDMGPVHGFSKGNFTRITLRQHLYIGGYDKLSLIHDRLGTGKGFVGCVEQLSINDYMYDMRGDNGIIGDTQFGLNVGDCSEGVCNYVMCQNGGTCMIKSADSYVCLCPLGTGGENCQHKTQVHIPEFRGHSYLEYKGLGRSALSFLEIEIVFKPSGPDGLILYNGYTNDRKGDFVSLAMKKSYLEFKFDLGTGPAVIRSAEPLTLNQWHRVKVSRTGLEGVMEIFQDIGNLVTISNSQGAFTQLTLTLNLFIGGHSNFDVTSKYANITQSFRGCIQKIVINNKPLQLIEDAISGVNIEGCEHPCVGHPCLNGGECVPKRDVYTCSCPLGYTGINCEKEAKNPADSPKFMGESYLMYMEKKVAKRISGNKIDIRMAIKPESPQGLLFWSSQDEMDSASDYVALGFVDGALQFRYNLGSGEAVLSYNDSKLFDGVWHYIHAQRDKQDGYLAVDESDVVEGSSKGTYTMLNTNKVLYIGGMPDVSKNTLRKFTTGFKGCIQDLILGEDLTLSLTENAQKGRNILPCS